MNNVRKMANGHVSALAMLVALAGVTPAVADTSDVETVVVTGSRGAPRAAADSSAPVATYSGEALGRTGLSNLNESLQYLDPAVNFAGSVNAGGAANARGATLLGLGQDEVLVLVDGKRRSASSLINFNATIGRGEVPVDLGLIPTSAIDHVEVLRDGASAQYGSDAIAGVINIILRKNDSGGSLSAQGGVTGKGDGANGELSGWQGFSIGNGGSLTLAESIRGLNPINRAGIDARAGVAGRITNQQGGDGSADIDFVANANLPIGSDWSAYGNLTFAQRHVANTIQFRLPNVDPAVYPDGFLPRTVLSLYDLQGSVGVRGELAGWDIDFSDSPGYDHADFRVDHSANPSLNAASPRAFDAGGARYFQNMADLQVGRQFDLLSGVNLAGGLEHRYEEYRLRSGEPGSYTGAGAFGFPGFNPPTPVDATRTAFSAYIDGELMLLPELRLGAAGRVEDYSDFGTDTTGKVSLFYKPLEQVAFRATASTGFRAPALQQSYFSTVTSQNNGGVLQNVGTFAVNDPVAKALGASPLKPEKSTNLSGGVVLTPTDDFTLTADVFQVNITDRIVLSETLSSARVTAILTSHGITNAASGRYFTNAADTHTSGFNITADWRRDFEDYGLINTALSYNVADSSVANLQTNPVIPAPDSANTLLGVGSIDFLTRAQPSNKVTGTLTWSLGDFGVEADVVHFGSFRVVPSTAPANMDQSFGPVIVLNLAGNVRISDTISMDGGIQNITDAYNDTVSTAFQGGTGLQYPEGGGVGFEGRQYFIRLTARY